MQTALAVSPGWGGAPSFDRFAFEGKRAHAVTKDTGISFSDFERMRIDKRAQKTTRRLPDPDFASDLSKLRRLVVAICETGLYIASHYRPFDESKSLDERIAEINRVAAARLPAHREALDALLVRHDEARHAGATKDHLRRLEIQIQNLDTRILLLPRIVAVMTTVLYRYYFLRWNSVQTCFDLPGMKPLGVRQMCRRARLVWDRLNRTRQLLALPSGEFVEMVAPSLQQRKVLGITRSTRRARPAPPLPSPAQRPRRDRWSSERIAKLAALCQDGNTWREIASQMGVVPHATVRRQAMLRKIDLPGSGWTPERLAELRRLSDAGYSWAEIGKRLGVRGPTARIAAMRHGILRHRTSKGWAFLEEAKCEAMSTN